MCPPSTQAWLMGLNATGVELLADRWSRACDAAGQLRASPFARALGAPGGLRLLRANFLDVDLSGSTL